MDIFAIDAATKTGWSTRINGQIESGVQDFSLKRGESPGIRFMRFNVWLENMITMAKFDLIVYEQAHHRGGAPTVVGVGLMTRIQEAAAKHAVEYTSVHTGTLKKFTTGKGNASKEEMMEWFKSKRGVAPIDDNESDAMALLYWAIAELDSGSAETGQESLKMD